MKRVWWSLMVMIVLMFPRMVSALGVEASPAFQQLEVKPQDRLVESEITLTNRSDIPISLDLRVVDFGSLDEAGGVAFLGLENKIGERKYSLASWLVLEKDHLELSSGESQRLKLSIVNKESLSPGGHYGAILATVEAPEGQSGRIGIKQAMSSLIFVKKAGGEKYDLKLDSIEINKTYWGWINKVGLRFQNTGNVHVVPRGIIKILDGMGKEVFQGTVNTDSEIVIPESFRKMETKMRSLSWWMWPGKYRVLVDFRYDGKSTFEEKVFGYWAVGTGYLWLGFFGLMVGGLGMVMIRKIRK